MSGAFDAAFSSWSVGLGWFFLVFFIFAFFSSQSVGLRFCFSANMRVKMYIWVLVRVFATLCMVHNVSGIFDLPASGPILVICLFVSRIQSTAARCNILQHTATYCNTLQSHVQNTATHWIALQHAAMHCNTLQHTAKHCEHSAVSHEHTIHGNALKHCPIMPRTTGLEDDLYDLQIAVQRIATHCSTLQHTATHCNTLQHIETHCNTQQDSRMN